MNRIRHLNFSIAHDGICYFLRSIRKTSLTTEEIELATMNEGFVKIRGFSSVSFYKFLRVFEGIILHIFEGF